MPPFNQEKRQAYIKITTPINQIHQGTRIENYRRRKLLTFDRHYPTVDMAQWPKYKYEWNFRCLGAQYGARIDRCLHFKQTATGFEEMMIRKGLHVWNARYDLLGGHCNVSETYYPDWEESCTAFRGLCANCFSHICLVQGAPPTQQTGSTWVSLEVFSVCFCHLSGQWVKQYAGYIHHFEFRAPTEA